MENQIVLFYILLLVIAFLYASVGHGGASGYLALMSFFSFAPETMRPTALLLNIVVSLIAFIQYYRGGHFKWEVFWPFALASVPAAFVGGFISVDAGVYKKILAVLLLISVVKLSGINIRTKALEIKQNTSIALIIGGCIGLFSGMIGIGGGIILSPVIVLLNWANMKQTAAVSALFILVNSLAGLAGLYLNGFDAGTTVLTMGIIAICGGLAGAYFGAKKFNNQLLKKLLAFVLLIASVKLMLT
ncbi:MAG: sulfite exporter TauE/SafE family protein [Bacteroidia bacterium]|nr:sulfite exporter TauE/SafE family protein [Bacteroidia bacterium]